MSLVFPKKKKCTALSHAVIAVVRPRSFLSPLLLGLGSFLYKKFGSRHLIDILSAVGFSSSYQETLILESSCIQRAQPQILPDAFSQFIFDYADFNINTLDGHGTFHTMGGIHCVSPYNATERDRRILRAPHTNTATLIGQYGVIPIKRYEKLDVHDKQPLITNNLDSIRLIDNDVVPTTCDLMWLYAKWSCNPQLLGWSGFMEEVHAGKSFCKSKILCLPFINAPPTDYDSIYTSLVLAVEKCKTINQRTCIVTPSIYHYI